MRAATFSSKSPSRPDLAAELIQVEHFYPGPDRASQPDPEDETRQALRDHLKGRSLFPSPLSLPFAAGELLLQDGNKIYLVSEWRRSQIFLGTGGMRYDMSV